MLRITQKAEGQKGFIGFKEKEAVHINKGKCFIQAPYSDVGIQVKLEEVLLVSK